MKGLLSSARETSGSFAKFQIIVVLAFVAAQLNPAAQTVLQMKNASDTPVLEWRGSVKLPFGSSYAEYKIERSSDLKNWETVAGPLPGTVGVADEALRKAVSASGNLSFYRVITTTQPGALQNDGAAQYGYADAFSKELQQLGQLPLDQFAQRYAPPVNYLPAVNFDVTQAQFWSNFNMDPATNNATNTVKRFTDFRFTPEEFGVFKTNGFIVSPRLGGYSFADAYYKVFTDDMPVFISTDAILQAWHRSYTLILEEEEEIYLAKSIEAIVTNMVAKLPELKTEAAGTPLEPGVRDADFFLAVAQSLITGVTSYGIFGQDTDVQATLTDIASLQVRVVQMFGSWRTNDYSQFKVRGHYENSITLQRYFRTLMWLGLIDLRLADPVRVEIGFDDSTLEPIFETRWQFAAAAALNVLLERSGQRQAWMNVDRTIQLFVGLGDALTFPQLNDILTAAQFAPPYSQLQQAFNDIMDGDLGVQNITSGYFTSPFSPDQLKLPRTFAFLSQRFTFDSWAFSKTVFDQIIWDENGIPEISDKVERRIPSSLDVAFAVFANNNVVGEIAGRIANPNGRIWRDGLLYQHNLAAVRNVLDQQDPTVWTNSIYNAWLKALRALSPPTTDPKFPKAMRTHAWALKTANTQLASWTQLRHDNVLYVKQSYTPNMGCRYPKGFVEPRVEFWEAMRDMVKISRDIISALPPGNNYVMSDFGTIIASPLDVKLARVKFLDDFAATLATIQSISEKELTNTDLSAVEISFLKNTIEQGSFYGSTRAFNGWYPKLFYRPAKQQSPYATNQGSDFWDALVTDVHTDTPDDYTGDRGCVLHEAVGNVHMAFVAIDCADGDLVMYAGPVLSHYEFEKDPTTRLSDSEWKTQLKSGAHPPSPEWTKSFLVPGDYQVPSTITP